MFKHPVPKQFRKDYNGAPPNPTDLRDIVLGDIPFVADPNTPSWVVGFDNEVKYGKMKREYQGSSSSCVGQGWSNYRQMLHLIETGNFINLSAKDIYLQIFLPQGGAYIRDGAKVEINAGNAEELVVPSYDGNNLPNHPTEDFMRSSAGLNPDHIQNALLFTEKNFVYLPISWPLSDQDWENMKQVIWQFGGFVSGFSAHCMYCSSYGLKNGKKFVKFVNSYGEGSDIYYQGQDRLYDITFLVKLDNPPDKINMLFLYGNSDTKEQYVKDNDSILHRIANTETLNDLHEGKIVDKNAVVWLSPTELAVHTIGNVWLSYSDV